ncbi:MAG: alpha/beta hydrolase-fold protein [Candidatus Kapabacteria bacterium]|jgi:enterochelin esterase family protein|nr:alpha/beta hydrolase-fold protein [Candidatus Kapabacteria bacterium]
MTKLSVSSRRIRSNVQIAVTLITTRFLHIPEITTMTTSHDIEILLHKIITEKRLAKRMALARALNVAMRNRTTPVIHGNKVIFLWEGASKHVNIIGDWTHWRQQIPMKRIRCTSWFYHTEEFKDDARLQYKFVIDGAAWENDPRNPHASQEGFGTNSELIMPTYKDESWLKPLHIDGKPLQHGEIVKCEVESAALGDKREVMLYLPHEYSLSADTTTKKSLPLLVMHDGAESLSLGRFHLILDHLIHAERIPPCVAVFIAPNLPKRNEEYTLNPAYLKFCTEEALPKALEEATKRGLVISDKPHERCIGGASLGGLLATYMAFHAPESFGVFFAQSPAYWWGKGVIFSAENLTNAARVHGILQTGTVADAHALTVRMKQELERLGAAPTYREFTQGHTWGNWRAGFARGVMDWFEYNQKL